MARNIAPGYCVVNTSGAGGVACAAVGSLVGGAAASAVNDYFMDMWLK